ncbi:MAG: nucleotidyltransferase domain-containing protein [Thermoplasmata archaeon]
MELLEERIRKREEVLKNAAEYASSLNYPCSVFLFGSYARGDFNLWSDVDIIIISDFDKNIRRRFDSLDFPPGFEVIPMRPEELFGSAPKKNFFLESIRNDLVVLRDDLQLQGKLRASP